MQFETFRRKLPYFLAIPVGAFALAGCGANYSGNGNEFVVDGKVTDPGHHSLKARIYMVEEANGEADDWFKPGTVHQIHDNCNCHGWDASNKRYGTVYGLNGQELNPSEVAIGACVEFEGKIRADQEGKVTEDRPVYDVAKVEQC